MKNGLTDQIDDFNATSNSLTCIEVLDPSWASENWTYENGNIDEGVTFDVICGSDDQNDWYVSTTGSDGSGSGTQESPFATIQTAINATTDGDTVSVAAGTYVENINFNGKNIAVIGADSSNTIIDGDSSGSVVTFSNGESSSAVLDGFTLQNGSANSGGGIYINAAKPVLNNLIIQNNTASGYAGGGIYMNAAYGIDISNSIVQNNSAVSMDGDLQEWGK